MRTPASTFSSSLPFSFYHLLLPSLPKRSFTAAFPKQRRRQEREGGRAEGNVKQNHRLMCNRSARRAKPTVCALCRPVALACLHASQLDNAQIARDKGKGGGSEEVREGRYLCASLEVVATFLGVAITWFGRITAWLCLEQRGRRENGGIREVL